MRKYILSLIVVASFANAGLINAIAMIVNDEPITLYEIDKTMQERSLSKNEAVKFLIDEKIYNQEVKKNNVSVDIFDVNNYIENLAAQNKMGALEFKSLVRQQQDYDAFEKKVKEQLLHQKLVRKIATGNIKIATEDDIKIYYENNKEQYTLANQIEVVAYVSKSKESLQKIQANPMANDTEVVSQTLSLKQNELTPQVKYIINTTAVNQFSAIFAQNQQYNMFFIKEKNDIQTLSLEQTKEQIFQKIMEQREKSYLNEYFETQKITANIKVLR
jgi:hypothetical protein